MGRKKGRQSNGFGSKARRAAFCTEWQSLASEVPLSRGTKKQSQTAQVLVAKERPKLRLNHLEHMLQERLHHDRIEDSAQRQHNHHKSKMRMQSKDASSPCLIYDDDDNDDDNCYRETGLVLACVKALAPVLQDYIRSMGKERIHYYLSLLPGKTLTALSVELSKRDLWKSDDMIDVVISHIAHISRLAIWLPPNDSKISNIDKALLQQQQQQQQQPKRRLVPESWEDDDDACLVDDVSIRRFTRLELRNIPSLKSTTLLCLLASSFTTHLSISGSMDWIEGPEFLDNLSNNITITTNLKVLDLTKCAWMTPTLLLKFHHKHANVQLLIHELEEATTHC
jgi:hypothetical protein